MILNNLHCLRMLGNVTHFLRKNRTKWCTVFCCQIRMTNQNSRKSRSWKFKRPKGTDVVWWEVIQRKFRHPQQQYFSSLLLLLHISFPYQKKVVMNQRMVMISNPSYFLKHRGLPPLPKFMLIKWRSLSSSKERDMKISLFLLARTRTRYLSGRWWDKSDRTCYGKLELSLSKPGGFESDYIDDQWHLPWAFLV